MDTHLILIIIVILILFTNSSHENFTVGGVYQQLWSNKDTAQSSYLMIPEKESNSTRVDVFNKNCTDCYDYTGFYS